MKNSIINNNHKRHWVFLLSSLVMLVLGSCNKDLRELNKGNQPLGLTVSSSDVVLLQKNDNGTGQTFNWTPGTNYGTNAAISYVLQIDKAGNNFADPVSTDMGKGASSLTYTVKDLNDLLLNRWQVAPGTKQDFEARVVDSVWGGSAKTDVSPVITFSATPYKPVTSTLYMIGDAAPNGWSADNATALNAGSDPGTFNWQGKLNAGNFKFITTLGQFLPSYNKGASDTKLVYRSDASEPDDQFSITEEGVYAVSVSLLDSTISVTKVAMPPYSTLYAIGDATPLGWGVDEPEQLTNDPNNPFLFKFNEVLSAGEFKFPVAKGQGYDVPFYMPLVNHPDLSATGLQLVPAGGVDYKWQITTAGAYKITLDLLNMAISIKPFTPYAQIYMLGDATTAGWSISNPVALVKDPSNPYVFTYTGPMLAGEFKFPVYKDASGSNWNGDYFMPYTNDEGISSTQMQFVPGGSPDTKWKITDPGNYKITIDQLHETISIVKQ